MHREESKLRKNITGYDVNRLYFYCSGDVMPCGKGTLVLNERPFELKQKKVKGTRCILGFVITPMIHWYLLDGLRLTAVHQLLEYEQCKPFA